MIEKTISHYQILEKIGEGGMGVVYKAEDTKLKRTVALKFLPPELTKDPQAKARFLQEAQAAAALDHPNICTIHEIDEFEGQMFIVMTYIKGQSLKERIALGPIQLEEALDISTQVSDGLRAAHEKGIIHRDIKPANIMLTEKGQAKIMDFGLAKLAWAADLTKTAGTMGTLAYMSPEQARGDAVDHRTDIWSLGVVLYEMLAGQLPFRGEETQGVVYSIINKDPERLSVLCPDVPRHIEQAVAKALAKDPARRYQNIQEFSKDLNAPTSFIFPKAEKSIIVLPFEDISPSRDNEYFSDGLTEEIIADLSQVHDLLVISRSSAMTFKGTKKTIPEIARAVNVRYVLEGSVRKAGNNLRITAQLIDATNDAHLWAEKYSGTLDDVFDIQEKVSQAIVGALRIRLSPAEQTRLAHRSIPDAIVYDDWLRARHLVRKYTTKGLEDAIVKLEAGLKRIGDNPQVMAGLAYIHIHVGMLGTEGEEAYDRAVAWATRALALDGALAQANLTLGIVEMLRGRPREALARLKAAQASEPGDWETHQWLAYLYAGVGRHAEALTHAHALVAIDPGEPLGELWVCWILLYDGKIQEAASILERIKVDLDQPHRRFCLAWVRAWLGQWELAENILAPVEAPEPYDYVTQLCLLLRDALRGDREAFRRNLVPDMVQSVRADAWGASILAECCGLLGDAEAALHWLDQAAGQGWFSYPLYSRTDPFFEPLRDDPRFEAFLKRVKYEWEHFEV